MFQAEGLTAIECWVIACIIFVFGALLEDTVILLKLKLKKVKIKNKFYRYSEFLCFPKISIIENIEEKFSVLTRNIKIKR